MIIQWPSKLGSTGSEGGKTVSKLALVVNILIDRVFVGDQPEFEITHQLTWYCSQHIPKGKERSKKNTSTIETDEEKRGKGKKTRVIVIYTR